MIFGNYKNKKSAAKSFLEQPALPDLKTMLYRMEEMYGENIAIREKHKDSMQAYSVKDLVSDVYALGTAMLDMGLEGKKIAIIGENSYYWIVSFLAVCCGVGVAVPLDKELTDGEIYNLLEKSDASAVFYSKTFSQSMKNHAKTKESLNAYVLMDKSEDSGEQCIKGLIKKGKNIISKGNNSYENKKPRPVSLAAIIFTSGTTGANKGVMLTHRNLASNIEGIAKNPLIKRSTFSVLPINHIYELNCNILPELYANTIININDSLRNLMANFILFKPEMAVLVPAFMEAFYEAIWQEAERSGKKVKLEKAVKVSNFLLRLGIDIRQKLFKEIHKKFGGKLKMIVCGGAAINQKYVLGLSDFGFDICIGYGLTEASPLAALNTNGRKHFESVGYEFNGTKIKIHKPNGEGIGEIWLKGKNISPGYYKDEKSTSLSFDSNWFKTGDYGRLSRKNQLYIMGRKKNLIILDNGKNVHPEEIENLIKEELTYAKEVVVMMTERQIKSKVQKNITAVLSINTDDFPDSSMPNIQKKASVDMANVNRKLAEYKMIRDIRITTKEFEKTSTNKIIRKKVEEEISKTEDT